MDMLENDPRKNVSKHSSYTEYYADELINLVAYKDRLILRLFEYEFGEESDK